MSPELKKIQIELKALANPAKAFVSQSFFKTKPGQYGAGDEFLGITVPQQRKVARKYRDLKLSEVKELLQSPIHEHRFTALEILVMQYEKAEPKLKEKIYKFYLTNSKYVNNWDLVDTSAPYISGDYLADRDKSILYKYAKSKNIWQRRIAMISTFGFIKKGNNKDTFKLAEILLQDSHDLIQKAVGWMLREAGNRDQQALEKFLLKNYSKMPRTALRYAIERVPEKRRLAYLKGLL